jgi:putative membrane protein
MNSESKTVAVLLAIFFTVSTWSVYRPHDYFTWFLEVLPAMVALAVLAPTYPRFRFTNGVYCIILLHAIVLLVGGHYTYAQVPVGNWFRDHFHLSRNHFDRLGHFLQGFTPALVFRELLLRLRVVRRGYWLSFIVFAISMMVTALYELFEYAVSAATGTAADAFLGTQGDPWDTQNDMLMCMIGTLTALIVFSRWQDRWIEKLEPARQAAHSG